MSTPETFTSQEDLFFAWQHELLRDEPDAAVIASLEVTATTEFGVSLPELLEDAFPEALTAAVRKKWNPDLHPRGKDGRFIDVGGWIKAFVNLANGPGGENFGKGDKEYRGKVTKITPDPARPGHPRISVDVKDANGVTRSVDLDRDDIQAAPDVKAVIGKTPDVDAPKVDAPAAPVAADLPTNGDVSFGDLPSRKPSEKVGTGNWRYESDSVLYQEDYDILQSLVDGPLNHGQIQTKVGSKGSPEADMVRLEGMGLVKADKKGNPAFRGGFDWSIRNDENSRVLATDEDGVVKAFSRNKFADADAAETDALASAPSILSDVSEDPNSPDFIDPEVEDFNTALETKINNFNAWGQLITEEDDLNEAFSRMIDENPDLIEDAANAVLTERGTPLTDKELDLLESRYNLEGFEGPSSSPADAGAPSPDAPASRNFKDPEEIGAATREFEAGELDVNDLSDEEASDLYDGLFDINATDNYDGLASAESTDELIEALNNRPSKSRGVSNNDAIAEANAPSSDVPDVDPEQFAEVNDVFETLSGQSDEMSSTRYDEYLGAMGTWSEDFDGEDPDVKRLTNGELEERAARIDTASQTVEEGELTDAAGNAAQMYRDYIRDGNDGGLPDNGESSADAPSGDVPDVDQGEFDEVDDVRTRLNDGAESSNSTRYDEYIDALNGWHDDFDGDDPNVKNLSNEELEDRAKEIDAASQTVEEGELTDVAGTAAAMYRDYIRDGNDRNDRNDRNNDESNADAPNNRNDRDRDSDSNLVRNARRLGPDGDLNPDGPNVDDPDDLPNVPENTEPELLSDELQAEVDAKIFETPAFTDILEEVNISFGLDDETNPPTADDIREANEEAISRLVDENPEMIRMAITGLDRELTPGEINSLQEAYGVDLSDLSPADDGPGASDVDVEDFVGGLDGPGSWAEPFPSDGSAGDVGWVDDGAMPGDQTLWDPNGDYLGSVEQGANGYDARDYDGTFGTFDTPEEAYRAVELRAISNALPEEWNTRGELVNTRGDVIGFVEQDDNGQWAAYGPEGQILDQDISKTQAQSLVEGPAGGKNTQRDRVVEGGAPAASTPSGAQSPEALEESILDANEENFEAGNTPDIGSPDAPAPGITAVEQDAIDRYAVRGDEFAPNNPNSPAIETAFAEFESDFTGDVPRATTMTDDELEAKAQELDDLAADLDDGTLPQGDDDWGDDLRDVAEVYRARKSGDAPEAAAPSPSDLPPGTTLEEWNTIDRVISDTDLDSGDQFPTYIPVEDAITELESDFSGDNPPVNSMTDAELEAKASRIDDLNTEIEDGIIETGGADVRDRLDEAAELYRARKTGTTDLPEDEDLGPRFDALSDEDQEFFDEQLDAGMTVPEAFAATEARGANGVGEDLPEDAPLGTPPIEYESDESRIDGLARRDDFDETEVSNEQLREIVESFENTDGTDLVNASPDEVNALRTRVNAEVERRGLTGFSTDGSWDPLEADTLDLPDETISANTADLPPAPEALAPDTVGNSLDGAPVQVGTRLTSVKDGITGEVTGWPDQEKYPGTVYIKPDGGGTKVARSIKRLKTPDSTAEGSSGPVKNPTPPAPTTVDSPSAPPAPDTTPAPAVSAPPAATSPQELLARSNAARDEMNMQMREEESQYEIDDPTIIERLTQDINAEFPNWRTEVPNGTVTIGPPSEAEQTFSAEQVRDFLLGL